MSASRGLRTAGLAVLLGAATGIRSSSGLWALSGSAAAPAGSALSRPGLRRSLQAAVSAEIAADKTGMLPPRTDPLPLAGRACLGAAAAAMAAAWLGSSRFGAACLGAGAAVITARAATSLRSAAASRGTPDLVAALGEDLVVVGLAAMSRGLVGGE